MKKLIDRILQDGRSLEGVILKVDKFINHQMDPYLMKQVAVEFVRRFSDLNVNKIITVEASGIAPSIMLGYMMELPVVFAKTRIESLAIVDSLENNIIHINNHHGTRNEILPELRHAAHQ